MTYIRLLFVGASLLLFMAGAAADNLALDGQPETGPVMVLAAGNTGGSGTSSGYANCMNGCWRSHSYCKKHQSKELNCDRQLGQCIEWCESQYDPQRGGSKTPAQPAPKVIR